MIQELGGGRGWGSPARAIPQSENGHGGKASRSEFGTGRCYVALGINRADGISLAGLIAVAPTARSSIRSAAIGRVNAVITVM
jgi:hypothetical protein